MSETLIKVDHVSKKFCRSLKKSLWYGLQDLGHEITGRSHGGENKLRQDEFWAVNDVSFELRRGECLGLIGHNGAGKTTLLKMLNGLIKPDTGRIEIRGRVGALLALGAGFNPILSGRENIYVNASVLGLSKREIDEKIDEIIDFSEINEFIDSPVQTYSSGMQVKLGFSVATVLKPDVLFLDEVLAVGDIRFQAKCYSKIAEIKNDCAVIFVSHSMSSIARMSDRVLFLEYGASHNFNLVQDGIATYLEMNRGKSNGLLKKEGTGKITIQDIRINVLNREVEGWGAVTSKIVVEIDVFALNDLTFCVDFIFRNLSGMAVAECPSTRNFPGVDISSNQRMTIKFVIDPVTLAPGPYACSLYLLDLNCAEHFHTWIDFKEINVIGDNRYTSPIQLDAEWETEVV